MRKVLLEVEGLGMITTIAVDDISAIREMGEGDSRCFIDLKTPLVGGAINRVTVEKPYRRLMEQLEALDEVNVVSLVGSS